ncbi:MAG: methionyl-tRNA formyltransferase [Chloroflexota bacterium]|jgi:methionyl-tRNA formyltransferase|nr:methionyl-tRNA formyltransferase [Chloroflexota bacterium]
MRVVFFGTPAFAVPSLRTLLEAHDVALVVSQPDRPAGRGMALRRSPVAVLADEAGVAVQTPARLGSAEVAAISEAGADVLVVAAYGRILPVDLLRAAPHGGINVHASLLPRWRGASPVAAAILAGDKVTGVSIMQMEVGLDSGPVLLQRTTSIFETDTAGELTARLAGLGAEALAAGLQEVEAGTAAFEPQPVDGVTYAPLVKKSDGDLAWDVTTGEIDRAIRAYEPWPGVRMPLGGEAVRIVLGRPVPHWFVDGKGMAAPGTVVEVRSDGIAVMAGDAPFLVQRLQPPGKKPMHATAYARGRRDLQVASG